MPRSQEQINSFRSAMLENVRLRDEVEENNRIIMQLEEDGRRLREESRQQIEDLLRQLAEPPRQRPSQ